MANPTGIINVKVGYQRTPKVQTISYGQKSEIKTERELEEQDYTYLIFKD